MRSSSSHPEVTPGDRRQPEAGPPRFVFGADGHMEMAMGVVRYFVVRQNDDWVVTLNGRPMAVHHSQPQAITSAIVMADLMGAMHHDADVMVEDQPGGPLRLVWTYGQDEMPVAPIRILQVVPSHSHVKRVRRPAELKAS